LSLPAAFDVIAHEVAPVVLQLLPVLDRLKMAQVELDAQRVSHHGQRGDLLAYFGGL
jgi:hypothetical protein